MYLPNAKVARAKGAHRDGSNRPAEPPEAGLKVAPRTPDVRPPDLERDRSGLLEEEEVEGPMAEEDRRLDDREVGRHARCERPEEPE